jgi:hypothetical protein
VVDPFFNIQGDEAMKSRNTLISRLACVLLAVLAINLGACHKSGGGDSGSATGSAQ